ncbi:MAG: CinA family nicotinamide mononucleotide deamidase-related protein [Desulfatiglandales bacterium]
MIGEVLTIGNELISGKTQDINAWYIAGTLTKSGLKVRRITSVGDDPEMVIKALKGTIEEASFVIVTGGLGSTEDDITNNVVAEALGRPLCLNEAMAEKIRRVARNRKIPVTESLMKMAYMPSGSKLLSQKGVSCGFYLIEKGVPIYFLPGIPEQMRHLLDHVVIPDIKNRFGVKGEIYFRVIRTYGISEPEIAEAFRREKLCLGKVLFGFYPKFPENHITITIDSPDLKDAKEALEEAQDRVLGLLGEYVFSVEDEELEEVVGKRLREKGLTLATAESCTGGLLGHRITNVPNSSTYYLGGVVAYSDKLKRELLGVRPQTLEEKGAVSEETVAEMAHSIRGLTGSHIGISLSGIAGPSGGTPMKPVGLVCFGLSSEDLLITRTYRFFGSREEIKKNSSSMALDMIRRYLYGYTFIPSL